MDGSLKLGGNIELFGVETLQPAQMVVLKKIIGMYARKFSEKGLESLKVSFAEGVSVEALCKGAVVSSAVNNSNLFFSVDSALKEVESKLL